MEQYEEIIHIQNFRAALPENFDNLNLAIYCDVDFVSYPEGLDPVLVQRRLIAEKITVPMVRLCENCEPVPDPSRCEEKVVQNIYVEPTQRVGVHYKNFQYVKLGKDLIRSHCAPECMNRKVMDSPYSINIKGTTLYSSFKEGTLYIRYYGTPMDEDCLPVIPKTPNSFLESYLEYHVKRRILEGAIMSKDSTNQQGIFSFIVQKEEDYYSKAKVDTSNIDMLALYRAIGSNRKRMNKYNINLGTYQSNYQNSSVLFPNNAWNNNKY